MRLTVRVTPRAGAERLEAGADGVLHVRVTVAPADGKANEAVCRVVAAALGIPKSSVRVARGATARVKQLDVAGDEQTLAARIASLAPADREGGGA